MSLNPSPTKPPIPKMSSFKNVEELLNYAKHNRPADRPSALEVLKNRIQEKQRKKKAQQQQRNKEYQQRNINKNYNLFQRQKNQIQISERVQKARQDHKQILDRVDRVTKPVIKQHNSNISVMQETNQKFQHSILQNQINNPESLNDKVIKPSNKVNIAVSSGNLFNLPAVSLQPNNLFNQPNNLFNQPATNVQPNSIFKLPATNVQSSNPFNQPATNLQSNSRQNPPSMLFKGQFGSKTQQQKHEIQKKSIFSSQPVQKQQQTQSIFQNPFNNNSISGNNIFGNRFDQSIGNINTSKSNENQQLQKKVALETQQKNKLPSQPAPINIFAQGLFSNQGNKGSKPTLVFNNNLINFSNSTTPSGNIFAKNQTSSILTGSLFNKNNQQPPKLLFNNNGATVETVKPTVNIFGGVDFSNKQNNDNNQSQSQESEISQMQSSQSISSKRSERQQVKAIFNQQQSKIQQLPKVTPTQLGSLFSKPAQVNPPQQTKPQIQVPKISLFSNPFTQNMNNQNKTIASSNTGLFSNPFQSSTPTPNPQTIQANNTNKGGLFGNSSMLKSDTPQPATPFGGLFTSSSNAQNVQNTTPTLNIANNNTNSGLTTNIFSNNNNNKFMPNMPSISQQKSLQANSSQTKNKGLFSQNKQPTNQTGGLFSNFNQSSNKLFPSQQQNTGLFGIQTSQQSKKQASLFSNPTSTNNLFLKKTDQTNIFSKPENKQAQQAKSIVTQPNPSTGNIFSSTSSLFGNVTQGSLFTNRGAGLFSKPNNEQEQEQDQQGQGQGDDLQQEQSPQITQGEMKFNYEEPQIIFRGQVVKFKDTIKNENPIQNVKISLQRFAGNKQVYIIVRTPNKQPIFIGLFLQMSSIRKLPKPQAVALDKTLQQKESKYLPVTQLKILFKNASDANTFINECNKIISNKKNKIE